MLAFNPFTSLPRIEIMLETCYICQSTAVLVEEPRKVAWGERSIVIEDRFYRCEECGETFYVGEMAEEASRRIAEGLRREIEESTKHISASSDR
jgi:YgiT-type zinc finger domain-containing protein